MYANHVAAIHYLLDLHAGKEVDLYNHPDRVGSLESASLFTILAPAHRISNRQRESHGKMKKSASAKHDMTRKGEASGPPWQQAAIKCPHGSFEGR
jgi:hypothetical protein